MRVYGSLANYVVYASTESAVCRMVDPKGPPMLPFDWFIQLPQNLESGLEVSNILKTKSKIISGKEFRKTIYWVYLLQLHNFVLFPSAKAYHMFSSC